MHAHTPPFTKPEAARLYDETSAIAAAQDAKLDPGNDALPSILADFRAVVKRLEAYAERLRGKRSNGIPAESAYLASFGPSNRAAPREDAAPLFATLRDVPDSFIDSHGCRVTRRHVAETATTVATSQHPANAEALRVADERTPEDRL